MPHWPHAPPHFLESDGIYMLTAGTYQKEPFFHDDTHLSLLHDLLLELAHRYHWALEAWSIFPNHYHFIARAPKDDAGSLRTLIRHLHSQSARELNRLESQPGRKVWHNYWESQLTYERSYLARLRYVHEIPVKHGVVSDPTDYPWCSAAWFEKTVQVEHRSRVLSMPIDRLQVSDDF